MALVDSTASFEEEIVVVVAVSSSPVSGTAGHEDGASSPAVPMAAIVESEPHIQYADATIANLPPSHVESNAERRLLASQVNYFEQRYRKSFLTFLLCFLLVLSVARSMGRVYALVGYGLIFILFINTIYLQQKWREAARNFHAHS